MSSNLLSVINQLLLERSIKLTNLDKVQLINKVTDSKLRLDNLFENSNKLKKEQINLIIQALDKIKSGYPIQYILGSVPFCENDFFVDSRVLIPRQETEELVYDLVKIIKKKYVDKDELLIADIGIGSGCIGISLKYLLNKYTKFLPKVYGVDISGDALEVARINAKKIILDDIELFQGDLLAPLIDNGIKVDVLVANLPYIQNNYKLDQEVLAEPHSALFGGELGTEIYEKLFQNINQVITDKTLIVIEIGFDQKDSITKLIKKYLPKREVNIEKDLFDNNRKVFILPII